MIEIMVQIKSGTWVNVQDIEYVHKRDHQTIRVGLSSGSIFEVEAGINDMWSVEEVMRKLIENINHAHHVVNNPPPTDECAKPLFQAHVQD